MVEDGDLVDRGGVQHDRPEQLDYAVLAADIHALNLQRDRIFRHALMADNVMDIMLPALIVHERGGYMTLEVIAMSGRLSMLEAKALSQNLVSAGLMQWDAISGQVMLTGRGVAKMREYIRMMEPIVGGRGH